jgi:hypothetical protein
VVGLERIQERSGIIGASLAVVKEKFNKALATGVQTKDVVVQHIKSRAGNRVELIIASDEHARRRGRTQDGWRWQHREHVSKGRPGFPSMATMYSLADVVKENGDGWTFRDDILEKFSEENSREGAKTVAKKVHWLSKPSEKPSGWILVLQRSPQILEHCRLKSPIH